MDTPEIVLRNIPFQWAKLVIFKCYSCSILLVVCLSGKRQSLKLFSHRFSLSLTLFGIIVSLSEDELAPKVGLHFGHLPFQMNGWKETTFRAFDDLFLTFSIESQEDFSFVFIRSFPTDSYDVIHFDHDIGEHELLRNWKFVCETKVNFRPQ